MTLKLFFLSLIFLISQQVFAAPSCIFYEFDRLGSYKEFHEEFFRDQMRYTLQKIQHQLIVRARSAGLTNNYQDQLSKRVEQKLSSSHRLLESYQVNFEREQVQNVLLARGDLANAPINQDLHHETYLSLNNIIQSQNSNVNLPDMSYLSNSDIKVASYALALTNLRAPVLNSLAQLSKPPSQDYYTVVEELDHAISSLDSKLSPEVLCQQGEKQNLEILTCPLTGEVMSSSFFSFNDDILSNLTKGLQKTNRLAEIRTDSNPDEIYSFLNSFGDFGEFKCDQDLHMQDLIGDCERQEQSYHRKKESYETGDFISSYVNGINELEKVLPLMRTRCDEWQRGSSSNRGPSPYINIVSRCATWKEHSHTILDVTCVNLNSGNAAIYRSYKSSFINRVKECRQSAGSFIGGGGLIHE